MLNRTRPEDTSSGRLRLVGQLSMVLVILTCLSALAYAAEDPPSQAGDGSAVRELAQGAPFWGLPLRGLVRFYQVTIGRVKYSSCPMEPSCSNFGIQALNTYPPHIAAMMIGDRLHRCGHDLHFYPRVLMEDRVKFMDPVEQDKFLFKQPSFEEPGVGR